MRWPFSKRPTPNPVAIPTPEGIDTDAFARVPEKLRRSDPAEAARLTREKNCKLFDFDRSRVESIGCTHYTWRTAKDGDSCEVCASREGVRFAYAEEPPHGHAGVCTACPQGWCRCWAEPVIPD